MRSGVSQRLVKELKKNEGRLRVITVRLVKVDVVQHASINKRQPIEDQYEI